MQFPEHRQLFTVKDVAHACGVSRATLIRMEESGFLTPFHVDSNSGYRYYDMQNIAAIGQYQRLQEAGLSRTEIAGLYHGRVDSAEFLEEQRRRLSAMQRFIDEYEIRHDHSKDHTIAIRSLPAVTCYCEEYVTASFKESAMLSFLAHERCVTKGYRLLGSESLMALTDDWHAWAASPYSEHRITVCIPVIPDQNAGVDSNLRFFPATEALTILGFGDYETVPRLWERLFEEADARGLEPSGPARFIALVAPYVGAHIAHDEFCHECVIPFSTQGKE